MYNIVYTSIIIRSQKGKYEQNTIVSNSRQVKRVNMNTIVDKSKGLIVGAVLSVVPPLPLGFQVNSAMSTKCKIQICKNIQLSLPLILTRNQVYNTTPSCENNIQR